MEVEFVSGCIKSILEKYADPIIEKISNLTKSEWEKFKIDSEIVFIKYLENSYDKYSKVKTILYRTEPKPLYNFFEFPNLEKSYDESIDSLDINNLLDISQFLIIQGTGGIGKSTFMKHLLINELYKKDLIPIFIELKDLNDIDSDYNISDFIFNKLYNLGSEINNEYLEHALKSGCFLFLLDGYDEILSDQKNVFLKKITDFCDRYSNNYYIISSRPYSEFVEFQRFTVLTLCEFTKEQALSLINKIDFDENIKSQFIKALDDSLYDNHTSFASNPLLLNIMLLTYDNYAEIPEKLHLFYANAFDTLYSKHDATKGGYKRELKSKLPFDSFKKVFSNFCFITYYQGKMEFTYDDLILFLKKSKNKSLEFNIEAIVDDLINSICVLYKDGLNYRFTHRSFQEYFTAIFLKELPDEYLNKMGIELIKKDTHRAIHDSVFSMLYDMSEERTEQNIILPLLEIIEEDCKIDKLDFYITKIKPKFEFDYVDDYGELDDSRIRLMWYSYTGDKYVQFIRDFAYNYRIIKRDNSEINENILLEYLKKHMNYTLGSEIAIMDFIGNQELYQLFKNTWIGDSINLIANLKDTLSNKKKECDLDLKELLLMN